VSDDVALSLAMLRRRIEAELKGEGCDVRLVLDRARFERDNGQLGGHGGSGGLPDGGIRYRPDETRPP